MENTSAQLIRKAKGRQSKIISIILGILYVFVMITLALETESTGERLIWVRYLGFVWCGFFAFVIPHLLFPDAKRYLLQTLNVPPSDLMRYALRIIQPITGIIILGYFLLVFVDPTNISGDITSKLLIFLIGALFIIGIAYTSLFQYVIIGRKSQEWQEGKTGEKLMHSLKQTGAVPSIPAGSFPSIATTTLLALIGMLLVVGGAYIAQITGTPSLELLPGFLLCLYAGIRFAKIMGWFDSFYYHTNSFYSELFLNPKAVQDGREPVQFKALYWVPTIWRTATWFSLLQLDRKQPLGRLLIVAHLILWTLFYAGLSNAVISLFILMIITGKSMAVYILITKPFAPLVFQYKLLPPVHWIGVRFFVNARWIPLLALSLWLVSLFTSKVDGTFILYWVGIDVLISLISAGLFTLLHEFRIKKIYA